MRSITVVNQVFAHSPSPPVVSEPVKNSVSDVVPRVCGPDKPATDGCWSGQEGHRKTRVEPIGEEEDLMQPQRREARVHAEALFSIQERLAYMCVCVCAHCINVCVLVCAMCMHMYVCVCVHRHV